MKKWITGILFVVSVAGTVSAQYSLDKPKPGFRERVYFGGGLGLAFGNVNMVDVSPRVSYMIHPRWYAGIGGNYFYYKNNLYNFHTNMYGVNMFVNYTVIKDFSNILPVKDNSGSLLLYAETNFINMAPEMDYVKQRNERFWLFQPMAGLGFKIPTGRRAYALILIMYNFNEMYYSPSGNPVINVSLMF
ncbi:MAG: hypothetical protein ACP5DZ_07580 [Bacteroidales bacterium]